MAKAKSQTNTTANILDILSLVTSIAFLAALTQHVNHLNQVNQHLTAVYLSHSAGPGFIVGPDFQLVPLAPIVVLLIGAAVTVRRRISPLLLASLAVSISASVVWLFGFHLAHI